MFFEKKMVYVFKTSVKNRNQIEEISEKIGLIKGIVEWNFDLEDCDNILRIVAKINVVKIVCETMNLLNYSCIELD